MTVLLWLINNGTLVSETVQMEDEVTVLATPLNPKDGSTEISSEQTALILYSAGNEYSEKLRGNIEKACRWMKIETVALDAFRSDTVSFMDYDMVILATQDTEREMGADIPRLYNYVEVGGKVLWATVQNELGSGFNSVYRKLGILDYGDYKTITEYSFIGDLIPGSKGLTFSNVDFEDAAIAFMLEGNCKVYVETIESHIPLIWSYDYGRGRSVVCNLTALSGDLYTGMVNGCIMALQDEFMYPVINAKAVFLDDFPSMQYNSDSDVIKNEYNRTVKEFYRDIWWPDMQSAAKKYDIKYTGVFMATYNDIVNPEEFTYSRDEMEQYYGNSLMKSGFEMGAHGYNHQSLTLEGGTPEEMQYKPWASIADMNASLRKLMEITQELFGNVKLQTYVPPSNYLSREGRMAVVESLPDLKIISGVYTNEGEEGEVYVQEFEIAGDGKAEFPRTTSGMLENAYDDFCMISTAGAYGVFSHFIHPDDILDADRGAGLTWQVLLDNFCQKVDTINKRYNGMRSLTATEAADALKIAYYAEVDYRVEENKLTGKIYNYYGEGYFYLKSERKPQAASAGCTVTQLNDLYESEFYLVHVTAPEFTITLE